MSNSILCVRENDVDGCGGFAQMYLLLDNPMTDVQKKAFKNELENMKAEADGNCLDTEAIVVSAYENVFGKEPHLLYIDEMEF